MKTSKKTGTTAKLGKTSVPTAKVEKTSVSTAKVVDFKSLSADELFLLTLKELGKPSLVRDMVKVIKKLKLVSTTKKKLLARFYASASHLNKNGLVKRIPVNGSMYMYSLIGWKQLNTKHKLRIAA